MRVLFVINPVALFYIELLVVSYIHICLDSLSRVGKTLNCAFKQVILYAYASSSHILHF